MSTDVRSRFDELRDVSLAERARELIRGAILDGRIKPNERLTIERIAGELGISRTPVREALKALEVDGLVRLLPHRGAVVESLALEELLHRYEVRAMLEGYAAELACRADAAGLVEPLEANCVALAELARGSAPDDPDAIRRLGALNAEFHGRIRDGSRSPTVIRLLESLRNPLAFTHYFWSSEERRDASIEAHRSIAAAFRAGDPAAARRRMERHLLVARDQLTGMDVT